MDSLLILQTDTGSEQRKAEIASQMSKMSEPVGVMKDDVYFDSYSDYSIHAEMLQDKVRTEAYRDTIYNNKNKIEGKTVADIGSGQFFSNSIFYNKTGVYCKTFRDWNLVDVCRTGRCQARVLV